MTSQRYERTSGVFVTAASGPDIAAVPDEAEADPRRVSLGGPRRSESAALPAVVRTQGIPIDPSLRPIRAGRTARRRTHYHTVWDLPNYYEPPANPVGESVLHPFDAADGEGVALSDWVHTASRIVKHFQDDDADFHCGRACLRAQDIRRFDCPGEPLPDKLSGVARPAATDGYATAEPLYRGGRHGRR